MSEKMKALWYRYGGWFLLGLPLAVVVIGLAAGQAHRTYVKYISSDVRKHEPQQQGTP